MTFFYDLNKKLDSIRAKPETTHQQLSEGKKPDFLDLNNNGNKTEPMKKAAKEKTVDEGVVGNLVNRGKEAYNTYQAKQAMIKAGAAQDAMRAGKAGATQQQVDTHAAQARTSANKAMANRYDRTGSTLSKNSNYGMDTDRENQAGLRKQGLIKEKTVDEGSTGDYSAKKAAAGKDIGKPGKNFSKIAAKSGGGEKGKRIAGAVLNKLRGKNESVEEAKKANKDYDQDGKIESGKDEYLGSRIRAAKKSGKMKEEELDEGWDDMMKDVKQRAHSTAGMKTGEKKRSSTGGEIEKTKTGLRHTAGKQYSGADADTDSKGTKGKAGRPKGPEKGPERVTANATKHKGGRKTNEGDNVCPHCGHELVAEKAVSQQQQKFMGMAHAMQKGEKVKGASPELKKVAKTMKKSDVKDFASTKRSDLPKKKKSVEEESADAPKASKGGMSFGKGIYDSLDRQLENMISESINMSVTMSKDDQGEPRKTISVTAEGADADKLAEILSLAGINSGEGAEHSAEPCSDCGQEQCGCDEVVDENAPDWPTNPEVTGSDDPLLRRWAGGLNGPKSTGQTTVPVIAHQGRQSSMESADIGMKLYAELKQYKAK